MSKSREEVDEISIEIIKEVEKCIQRLHQKQKDPAVLLAVLTGLSAALQAKHRVVCETILNEEGQETLYHMKAQATDEAYKEYKEQMHFAEFIKNTMGL